MIIPKTIRPYFTGFIALFLSAVLCFSGCGVLPAGTGAETGSDGQETTFYADMDRTEDVVDSGEGASSFTRYNPENLPDAGDQTDSGNEQGGTPDGGKSLEGETDPEGTDPTEESSAEPAEESTEKPSSDPGQKSTLKVRFISIGQGDCTLLSCDGHYMIIDGGRPEDSQKVYSILNREGVTHFDYVVGTHADGDHVGGLSAALTVASADHVLCSVTSYSTSAFSSFANKAAARGCPIEVPKVGDTFTLGSAVVTILGPLSAGDSPNNNSLVLRIQHGNRVFLFTGDAERAEESELVASGASLKCDVLQVGHHGSYTSSSYAFLNKALPDYAIISCGSGNEYGHPHSETISRFRDLYKARGTTLFRTDLQGDILFLSDGKNLSYATEKSAAMSALYTPGGASYSLMPEGLYSEEPTTEAPTIPEETTAAPDPNVHTYYAHITSKKFHYPDCEYGSQISERNKVILTCTREEAIAQGYIPCGACNP